jgi:hypothetical protein
MKTKEAVAMILLREPAKNMEISDRVRRMEVNDCPSFQRVPGGIYCKEAINFVRRLLIAGYTNFTDDGYTLTPSGKKLCGRMVAEALFREKFGSELTREVFEEKHLM